MKPLRFAALPWACLLLLLTACSAPEEKQLLPSTGKDFCSAIHRNDSLSLQKELQAFSERMKQQTGVYVLEDGDAAMVTRAWLSEYATKTMDIQYFIFSVDNVGLIACDYIVRAANRGVKVRLLVDDIMVEAGLQEVLALNAHPNIEIKVYNPGVNLGKNIAQKLLRFASNFKSANQRMHNKTFCVDGQVAITGGRNIADEYFDYDHAYNFRDRDVLLIGNVCTQVQQSFDAFWDSDLSVPAMQLASEKEQVKEGTVNYDRLHAYACNPENFWPQVREKITQVPQAFKNLNDAGKVVWTSGVFFISDDPGKNKSAGLNGGGKTTDSLAALIKRAKQNIYIQSPYLVTTKGMRKLLADAVQRGVNVFILTNSLGSTDNLEAFSGYQRNRQDLLKTGVRVFEMKPNAQKRYTLMTGALQQKLDFAPVFGLHAKSMVVDDSVTVVGTFNFDPRSANLNTECVAIVHSKTIAKGVLAEMQEELEPANAWETTRAWNPDAEAGLKKRAKTASRRIVPKAIL